MAANHAASEGACRLVVLVERVALRSLVLSALESLPSPEVVQRQLARIYGKAESEGCKLELAHFCDEQNEIRSKVCVSADLVLLQKRADALVVWAAALEQRIHRLERGYVAFGEGSEVHVLRITRSNLDAVAQNRSAWSRRVSGLLAQVRNLRTGLESRRLLEVTRTIQRFVTEAQLELNR